MADSIEQVSKSVDTRLDMTDERGLKELSGAFDEAFGPREGAREPEAKEPKAPKAKAAPEPARAREKAAPGHHAPVEVKSAPGGAQEAGRGLGLLGEPLHQAKKRERRINFEDDIPVTDKKTAAFPGRDKVKGGAVTPALEEGEPTEPEEEPGKEEADPEVDAVVAKPNAHPNVKEGIQRLKTIAKARRAEIRSLTSKADQLTQELEGLKRNGLSPEMQKELDRLRATSQRFDLLNDPEFKSRYEDPIEAAGEQILNFCVQLAEGDQSIKKWAEETRKFGFKNLSTDYWDKEIIPKIASVTNQQRVASLAASLHAKIDERNRLVSDYTSSPDKIAQYNNQRAYDYYTGYQKEAQAEADALVTTVGEWAQLKDPNKAASDEERAEYGEHNARVEGYKTLFEKTMGDVMHGGPRKHVRVVAQAVFGMELDRQLQETRADLEALQGEYDALRAQYQRITRTRAIPGRTGGGVDVKGPAQNGLSTRDARSALNEYFGPRGS